MTAFVNNIMKVMGTPPVLLLIIAHKTESVLLILTVQILTQDTNATAARDIKNKATSVSLSTHARSTTVDAQLTLFVDRNLKDQLTIISALAKPDITEMGLHANRSTPVRLTIATKMLIAFLIRLFKLKLTITVDVNRVTVEMDLSVMKLSIPVPEYLVAQMQAKNSSRLVIRSPVSVNVMSVTREMAKIVNLLTHAMETTAT